MSCAVTLSVDIANLEALIYFMHPLRASRTVKIVGTKVGVHGGKVLVYRQKYGASSWSDNSDPVGKQLDPRMSYQALGPIVGPFFGYAKIDERTYTMPTLDEYHRAINKINQDERVVSAGGFLVTGDFGSADYLKTFVQTGALPVSDVLENGDETYLFHDTCLHLTGLLLFPPELKSQLEKLVAIPEEFKKYLETKKIKLAQAKEAQKLQQDAQNLMSSLLDSFSFLPVILKIGDKSFIYGAESLSILLVKSSQRKEFYFRHRLELGPKTSKAEHTFIRFLHNLAPDVQLAHLLKQFSPENKNISSASEQVTSLCREHFENLETRVSDFYGVCKAR